MGDTAEKAEAFRRWLRWRDMEHDKEFQCRFDEVIRERDEATRERDEIIQALQDCVEAVRTEGRIPPVLEARAAALCKEI